MGAGTSTLSTRKHSHSQRRRVRQLLRSLSSLLRLLRDAQGQASHSQPNAYPRSGWRADLVGSRVCSSGTTAGSIQLATTAALSDMYEPNQYVMNCGIVDPTAGLFASAVYQSQPQQRRRNRPSRPSHSWWQHGHPRHLSLRYHPPVIFTLHLKFIFHMKFVGPVDVRSLNTPSGAVTLYRPFLSILIQKMEIGDGDYKEMWSSPCSIQPQRAGGTQGTPYKYIGLGYW